MNKIGVHFGYFNRNWNTDFVKQIDVIKRNWTGHHGSCTGSLIGINENTER